MTEQQRFEALTPGTADAIDAMFEMASKITECELSIADLEEACRLAIAPGSHGSISLSLAMISIAVERSSKAMIREECVNG